MSPGLTPRSRIVIPHASGDQQEVAMHQIQIRMNR